MNPQTPSDYIFGYLGESNLDPEDFMQIENIFAFGGSMKLVKEGWSYVPDDILNFIRGVSRYRTRMCKEIADKINLENQKAELEELVKLGS